MFRVFKSFVMAFLVCSVFMTSALCCCLENGDGFATKAKASTCQKHCQPKHCKSDSDKSHKDHSPQHECDCPKVLAEITSSKLSNPSFNPSEAFRNIFDHLFPNHEVAFSNLTTSAVRDFYQAFHDQQKSPPLFILHHTFRI